ncbi:MAG: glycosyltransferase family 9 protein [Betaproteobacteria bacterium]|nr:glycosyltransferase family 9 protein [Betaproteobacteria bacterium]
MYSKLKHLGEDGGTIGALGARISMLWELRRRRMGLVIVAAGDQDKRATRLARLLGARRVVCAERAVPGQHEVERTFTAARLIGIQGPIPALRIVPDAGSRRSARLQIERARPDPAGKVVGLHISARRAMQRWPAENFAKLANSLHERHNATLLLFWSPGAESHPQHPGDDEKAGAVKELAAGTAVIVPWPTASLHELIGGLAECDAVVCSDGGAMHIAAALGKPIACFFGDSDVARWRPWGARHVVLTAASRRVADITVQETVAAAGALLGA